MAHTIILADDEPIVRLDLREMLEDAGYSVIAEAGDGFDAVELCRQHRPDLAILDIKMPLLDGLKAGHIINDEKLATSILLLTAYGNKECIEQAKNIEALGYVLKPIREEALLPMVAITIHTGEVIENIRTESKKDRQRLQDRSLIEKAKGILMRENDFTEEEAFQNIRKLGMDKRCSMSEIAKIIIINTSND